MTIYTDGACKGNPGPGGWGAWLSAGGRERELWGGEALTTNNRLELTCNGLDPNGIGLMVWGTTQLNIPLPYCPMLNDFVWGHVVNLDATGSHTWERSWPASVLGYYYVQFGSVTFPASGGFVVMTTDSIRIECN